MKITHHDNRGTSDCAFGFVYFDDGVRVGYTNSTDPKQRIWPGNWGPATRKHLKVAEKYLVEKGMIPVLNK